MAENLTVEQQLVEANEKLGASEEKLTEAIGVVGRLQKEIDAVSLNTLKLKRVQNVVGGVILREQTTNGRNAYVRVRSFLQALSKARSTDEIEAATISLDKKRNAV